MVLDRAQIHWRSLLGRLHLPLLLDRGPHLFKIESTSFAVDVLLKRKPKLAIQHGADGPRHAVHEHVIPPSQED